MSLDMSENPPVGEKLQIPNSRIIKLEPTWSSIKSLIPPLSKESIKIIKDEKIAQGAFIDSQWVNIVKDAQDRILPTTKEGMGIRAIMVSTEGPVHLVTNKGASYDISNMETVLKNGTEMALGDTLVSRHLEHDDEINGLSHHRVLQYLVNGVNNILNAKEPEMKQKLTPAILIYDLSQLELISGYQHKLRDPKQADKAILALYPIDIDPAK